MYFWQLNLLNTKHNCFTASFLVTFIQYVTELLFMLAHNKKERKGKKKNITTIQ